MIGIVVFKNSVNDKEFSVADAIDLFYGNNLGELGNFQQYDLVEQLIQFTEEDFYESDLEEILNIIDNYIKGMPLEISERNGLYNKEIIEKCFNQLLKYSKSNKSNKFINSVLVLFRYSIENNKNIYFFF